MAINEAIIDTRSSLNMIEKMATAPMILTSFGILKVGLKLEPDQLSSVEERLMKP